MSKGNLLLGFGRGKVGDVVFYRANGEQVTRARNRSPKNPKSARQCVARCILKTVSDAYSVFQPLADHSFENRATGTPNQSRFTQMNVDFLRTRALEGVDLSDPAAIAASQLVNYAGKPLTLPVVNEYYISEGILPPMVASISATSARMAVPTSMPSFPTYAQVCQYLGLMQGDQLTFVWAYGNDAEQGMDGLITSIEYSRVILEPSTGNMSSALFTDDGSIVNPNDRNTGRVMIDASESGYWDILPATGTFGTQGGSRVIIGFAVIVSRRQGDTWKRSTARLAVRESGITSPWSRYLGDAALSFTEVNSGSSLYLNQATGF